ncbi:MAG: polyketide synthase [Verrucomicrobiales bacterium]|nr:polyketide synthase [Verrucomicrobiales bacterium]
MSDATPQSNDLEIAIIGMAGRFPGAGSVAEFWENLKASRESIVPLSDDYLREHGVSEAELLDPDYIKVAGLLDEADHFDAILFGYSPREAELLDPQQRLFLECSWEALETAGYDSHRYEGPIGIFGGAGMNGYLLNLYSNPEVRSSATPYELFVSNDKDFLATRVAYKLNLRGPALSIQTACSSSLVAVHTACQSLLAGECDMALAGGVAVARHIGYRAQEGNILSHDGHCRPFDAEASGTVGGNGVGIVVLKRLNDALADGDTIDAVIRGSAVTNDGAHKVSYTAPQVDSQAETIFNALTAAEVSAESISYVEGHGTGTPMGDPIEIAALNLAFRRQTERKQFCALGSVKSNLGHLDAAAGVAGLIKTVLALKHRKIPASLYYNAANPEIDFENSPFFVNLDLADWKSDGAPRRAGVSSFGIGGTNAHVVLEEHPCAESSRSAGFQIRRPSPTEKTSERSIPSPATELSAGLETCDTSSADSVAVLPLSAASVSALEQQQKRLSEFLEANPDVPLNDVAFTLQEGRRPLQYRATVSSPIQRALENPSTIFLCPGQGTKVGDALRNDAYDQCQEWIASSPEERGVVETECLALFSRQYAIARMLLSHGIKPAALLGHSFGEIVAACIADVFDLESALRFVAHRGRLQDECSEGAMLAAALSSSEVASYLKATLSLAAHNGPKWVTISGSTDDIASLEELLTRDSVAFKKLTTNRAFHSSLVGNATEQLPAALADIEFEAPSIPFISGVTGDWITEADATDPKYWARQLRETVQFHRGVETVCKLPNPVFIELSEGATLSRFVSQQSEAPTRHLRSSQQALIADIWSTGVNVDWKATRPTNYQLRRVPLPTYPFERQRFWVHPYRPSATQVATPVTREIDDWFYYPRWQQSIARSVATSATDRPRWLVFVDPEGLGDDLAQVAEKKGADVFCVEPGERFDSCGFRRFSSNSDSIDDLFDELVQRETPPQQIVYLWSAEDSQPTGLLNLVQAAGKLAEQIGINVVTKGAQSVLGTEEFRPSGLPALCRVIGQEYPNLGCRVIDVDDSRPAHFLWDELRVPNPPPLVALRGSNRWQQAFVPLQVPAASKKLRASDKFLIVGDESSEVGRAWSKALGQTDFVSPDSLDAIKERIGVRGIFVCSPTTNDKCAAPLSLLSDDHWQYNARTKIELLQSLLPIIQETKPEFVCVQSSMSTVLGGIGLAAYAAANQQLNDFVTHQNRAGTIRWYSVNWDRVVADADDEKPTLQLSNNDDSQPLTAEELWDCTQRILQETPPGVYAVSQQPLEARIEKWVSASPREVGNETAASHTRPDLPTPFVAPSSDVEKTIVKIWEEFLGIEGIGINDNFFALGGHSLLAIQVVSRLREAFPVGIELKHLVSDNPTPASIAEVLESMLPKGDNLDQMAALLNEIESMTPDEAQSALKKS